MDSRQRFDEALEPIRQALEADGYRLELEAGSAGDAVRLRIRATESACEECLVPEPMMRMMIDDTVATAVGAGVPYELLYPHDPTVS